MFHLAQGTARNADKQRWVDINCFAALKSTERKKHLTSSYYSIQGGVRVLYRRCDSLCVIFPPKPVTARTSSLHFFASGLAPWIQTAYIGLY